MPGKIAATDLAPSYQVLYNIGQVYFQLQDYAGALGALESTPGLGDSVLVPLGKIDSNPPPGGVLGGSGGAALDPITLDAALRLGSLQPKDVGSDAAVLAITLDDTDGFSLTTGPDGWTAVFGTSTVAVRALSGGNMQKLILGRALLAPHEQERLLARIRAEVTIDWQTAEHPREHKHHWCADPHPEERGRETGDVHTSNQKWSDAPCDSTEKHYR